MIKIISLPSASEVEDSMNKWISSNDITIDSIYYSTTLYEENLQHSVLINYTPKEKNQTE